MEDVIHWNVMEFQEFILFSWSFFIRWVYICVTAVAELMSGTWHRWMQVNLSSNQIKHFSCSLDQNVCIKRMVINILLISQSNTYESDKSVYAKLNLTHYISLTIKQYFQTMYTIRIIQASGQTTTGTVYVVK